MKQNNILYFFMGCVMMMASCNQSPNNTKTPALAEDDRPPLECTDADRTFSVVLEITSDSLLICHNEFLNKEDNSIVLDISNPGFNDFFAEWFHSLDSIQANELQNTSTLHIIVGANVTSATVDRVKTAIRYCGIEKYSLSNFDIDNE